MASFTICALLVPIFAPPVAASGPYLAPIGIDKYGPVNEDLPLWYEVWRDLNVRYEAWTTPYRPENSRVGDPSSVDDSNTRLSVENTPFPSKDLDPAENSDDLNKLPVEKRISEGDADAEAPVEANIERISESNPTIPATAAPARYVNQLPEPERESIYAYENNLGAPPGQVELDSSNEAAALPIKHRAGIANFSFEIPLAALSGRGIDAGVSMTYNSRTWNKSCVGVDQQGNCNQNHFTYDVEQSWIAPGFSTGFGYLESTAAVRYKHPHESSDFQYHTEITPLGVTDSDGTRRQLTCKAFNPPFPGTYTTSCATYGTSDGTLISTPARSWAYNPGNSQTPNTTGYSSATFLVKYPNGMRILYSGGFGSGEFRKHYPVMIQDRNGNYIQIAYKADQSGRIDHITDTLNRQIKFYYENDSYGNPDKLVTVTIPGMNEGDEIRTVRFYYENLTLEPGGFGANAQVTAPNGPIRVLKYIYIPSSNTGYKYDYHPKYGMIRKIDRFAGMTVSDANSVTTTGTVTNETSWAWAASTAYDFPNGPELDVPKYTLRTDDWRGRIGDPQVTHYNFPEGGAEHISEIRVRDVGFDILTTTVSDATGLVRESSIYQEATTNTHYSKLMTKNKFVWSGDRMLTSLTTTDESALQKRTEFEYDGYHNQTEIREYGYFRGSESPTLLRTTQMEYVTDTGWLKNNLTGLVKSVKTIVGGAVVSKTLYEYDNYAEQPFADAPGVMQHLQTYNVFSTETQNGACLLWSPANSSPSCSAEGQAVQYWCGGGWCEGTCECQEYEQVPVYDPDTNYRGNVTKITAFSDASLASDPNAVITRLKYDITGNVVESGANCCREKSWTYDLANGYAFPVAETKGSTGQLVNTSTYNRNTGLLLSSTDPNGRVTEYQYETDTLRPKKTIYPNGGYVLTEYSDKLISTPADLLPGFVRQTTLLDASHTSQSYSYFDPRGSSIRTATQTPDGWSISAVEYDALGRPVKSYNPFYGQTPIAPIPSGMPFTRVSKFDGLGRALEVVLQDGTIMATEIGDINNSPTTFNSSWVKVTDQAGKQRRQVIDALGRVVRVDEPDASGNIGALESPTQPTFYQYDGNDNLAKVIQSDGTSTQERKFKYDALSRLIAEQQVEASPTLDLNGIKGPADESKWTKVLKYNADGLLEWGVDARGVKTAFAYDGLNRVSNVTYTGETGHQTPGVTYTYDQARSGHFNHGALTRVETAAVGDIPATATEFDYDNMGRTVKHRQWIGGQQYDMEYGYNLAGQLTSEKYPSGRIVTNSYDANGRLNGISDASRTYLSGLTYQGKGNSLSTMTFGNGTMQGFTLNDRLQMIGQELKRGSEVLQRYDYGYGQIDAAGNLDTSKNNGQLARIESFIGANKQWTQKFAYDAIGRLKQAEERRGDTNALSYKQVFDHDRFGNMFRKAAQNPTDGQQTPLPASWIEETEISKSTNRFTSGAVYDEAGNVVQDTRFRDSNFWYDANGRMVKAAGTNNSNTGVSVYDASGMRVAEKVDGTWRLLVYDIGGKCVAEYGGGPAADEGGAKYVLQDWQGSVRAVVNGSGFVVARADFTPYGEEIGALTGPRTAAQGFGAAGMPARYAMTERDGATGLDHTWFRKNENRAGRWTSPDPYNGSMSLGDPQSFNRYSYVTNDPVNFVDPSGLNASSGTEIVWCEQDRWDPVTQNYYIGRCYRYAMGSTGSTGTTVTNQPLEGFPSNGGVILGFDRGNGRSISRAEDQQSRLLRVLKACVAAAKRAYEARVADSMKKYASTSVGVTWQDIGATAGLGFLTLVGGASGGSVLVSAGLGLFGAVGLRVVSRETSRIMAAQFDDKYVGAMKRCNDSYRASGGQKIYRENL